MKNTKKKSMKNTRKKETVKIRIRMSQMQEANELCKSFLQKESKRKRLINP